MDDRTDEVAAESLHRLHRVDARSIWKREAHDFTPWLLANIDQLNEAIGFEVELSNREEPVGSFAVDLFGRDVQTGQPAIIENQLEDTDHRHLGQLVTYAAGLDAGLVVWIAPRFRSEHREALSWLNQISSESVSFFGVELEILEINGHRAANFKLVAEPNAWQKATTAMARSAGGVVSDRMLAYQGFYADMLEQLKREAPGVTAATRTQPQSWFTFAAGRAGTYFGAAFTSDGRFRVEIGIDTGDTQRNHSAIEWLWSRSTGSSEFPDMVPALELDLSDSRRGQRIVAYAPWPVTINDPQPVLDKTRDWGANMLRQMAAHFRPLVKTMPA